MARDEFLIEWWWSSDCPLPLPSQETIDAVSHSGTLPMSIVIVNVAEEGKGYDDARLQVGL